MEQPDLKAVKVDGKTPQPLDQKLKAVSTAEKCISHREQVPTPAAGCAALAWTINPWGRNAAVLNLWSSSKPLGGDKSLPWRWC